MVLHPARYGNGVGGLRTAHTTLFPQLHGDILLLTYLLTSGPRRGQPCIFSQTTQYG